MRTILSKSGVPLFVAILIVVARLSSIRSADCVESQLIRQIIIMLAEIITDIRFIIFFIFKSPHLNKKFEMRRFE